MFLRTKRLKEIDVPGQQINLYLTTKSVHFYYTPVYSKNAFIKNIFNKDLCKNVHDKEIQMALSKWQVP